jgi:hypothetical protein
MRKTFEKEGQRFTGKIYLVQEVGLHSLRVQGREYFTPALMQPDFSYFR